MMHLVMQHPELGNPASLPNPLLAVIVLLLVSCVLTLLVKH